MNKLIRLFNQNIRKIIVGVLAIVFVFVIINVLNEVAKENNKIAQNEIKENNVITNTNNKVNYEKQSTSLITGEKVSDQYQDTFGKLIDNFLEACLEGNTEEAYNLLSQDCKEELYSSKEIFIDKYCKDKFIGNRKYSFQAWSAKEPYIYKIKIFEDMLASGKANTNYIEDYYTIAEENGDYKLNISSFIGKVDKNSENTKNGVTVKIKNIKVYLNYLVYNLEVENSTENAILLDRRKLTDETYLMDKSGALYTALLHENTEDDLLVESQDKKEIEIKFSCVYQDNTRIAGMVFSKVIPNYEQYKQNIEEYEDFYEIEVEQ